MTESPVDLASRRLRERLLARVTIDPDTGCWLWLGAKSNGYGRMSMGGKVRGAHRLSYFLFRDRWLPCLSIDHLCRNPPCVNPCHLELVPLAENCRRRNQAQAAARMGTPS